jgi:hypothetical protein
VKRFKQITAILPKGKGLPLLTALKDDKKLVTATLNFARGVGKMTPLRYRGVGEQTEKEIISVIVTADIAEDIYTFVYEFSDLNHPHAGIVYMNALGASNEFSLPTDLKDEK